MDGFKGLIELRHEFPAVPIVIVSATEEPAVIRAAIAHGAAGFIPKSLDRGQIADALQAVLDGGTWVPDGVLQHAVDGQADRQQELAQKMASLTAQQLKVLELVAQGKPNKVIAYELDIAETTVKAHITVVLRKLGVHSRTQAVLLARDVFAAPA
jgi:DNA-binding NarL/FixJ family response regulator